MKKTYLNKIAFCVFFAVLLSASVLSFPIGAESAIPEAKTPGGDDITLAILIVSGLLAIASFIAFLISLSSIRNKPTSKGEKNEHHH